MPGPLLFSVSPVYFVAVKEDGTWKDGRWQIKRTVRCDHRHRDPATALDCLRHNRKGSRGPADAADPRPGMAGAWWPPFGTVLRVGPDGETVEQTVRPDRFTETRQPLRAPGLATDVSVTWRRWTYEHRHEEMEITVGQYEFPGEPPTEPQPTFDGTERTRTHHACTGPHFANGTGYGVAYLLALPLDELVLAWHEARRPPTQAEPAPAVETNLILGPWKAPAGDAG